MAEMTEIRAETTDGVLRVQLNRPRQRNALSVPVLKELVRVLEAGARDAAVRVFVLTGSERTFCAGADLAEWAAAEARGELDTYGWTEAAHALMRLLHGWPKPTIAAVNGSAVGAGVDLALCCDFRFAARSARFRAGYTTMAYAPDAGSSWHLPRLLGEERAKRYLFLDEWWSAEQALAAGMVGEVVDDDQLASNANAFAARLAAGPTLAYKLTKQLMRMSAANDLPTQLAAEQTAGLVCGHSQDAAEALRAVAEKRKPHFTGR